MVIKMSRKAISHFIIISSCLCAAILLHLSFRKTDRTAEEVGRKVELIDLSKERPNLPLIFVGGMPRTGTTLMRTMLDAHPDIRCGPETMVIQEILNTNYQWKKSANIVRRLTDAGVYPKALDHAVAQFILEIIIGHGPSAAHYCNKDPYTASYTKYLNKIFPNAKFIMMSRDGRAFAHSVITRKIAIRGFGKINYRDILSNWNEQIGKMYAQCQDVGSKVCYLVRYEELVLRPTENMKKILEFLRIPWNLKVLHHEDYLNETSNPHHEYSSSQVSKPLYLDALTSWFGKIPKDVEEDLTAIAPMLKILGYNPKDPKPNYGEPDDYVKAKLKKEEDKQKQKLFLKGKESQKNQAIGPPPLFHKVA